MEKLCFGNLKRFSGKTILLPGEWKDETKKKRWKYQRVIPVRLLAGATNITVNILASLYNSRICMKPAINKLIDWS